jgi:hypothetical protein
VRVVTTSMQVVAARHGVFPPFAETPLHRSSAAAGDLTAPTKTKLTERMTLVTPGDTTSGSSDDTWC